jgi:POT family proton-dependent oligopeptide transporter
MTIFKQYPSGFGSLFSTQAFFNFSFYGLKSIFILYAIGQFSLSEAEAIGFFATLMALSYATSLIGGWIADNKLGTKNTIVLGGVLQALGISCLLFTSKELFFLALALISLGSGFYKPNLSSSVGQLFEDSRDPQKDKAYSTYYIAMNLGSFAAPLCCGFVGKVYGGYYSSLLLMIITLVGGAYLFYQKLNFKQEKVQRIHKHAFLSHPAFLGTCFVVLLGILYLLFKCHESFSHLMGVIALFSLLYLGKIFYQSSSQERGDVLSIILYILLFTLFCALFEQAGSSLMLFFDKAVDRQFLGIEYPPAVLLSLGPIFVLICSPLLIVFSEKILEKNNPMDGFVKIGIGFVLTGISFAILALSCYTQNDLASPLWVVGAIFIQTFGELLIVPIGFANISKLAPPRFRSLMMSFWLMAIAYGHYLGGFIARFSVSNSAVAEVSLAHYSTFFWNLGFMACGLGVVLFIYYYVKPFKNLGKVNKASGD